MCAWSGGEAWRSRGVRGRPRRPAAAEAAAPGGAAGTPAAERAMRVARWLAGLLCPLSLLLTQSRGVRFHPGQGKQAVTKGGDRPGGGGGVPALRAGRRRRRRERFLAVGGVWGSSDRSGVWRQGGPSCPVPPPLPSPAAVTGHLASATSDVPGAVWVEVYRRAVGSD